MLTGFISFYEANNWDSNLCWNFSLGEMHEVGGSQVHFYKGSCVTHTQLLNC